MINLLTQFGDLSRYDFEEPGSSGFIGGFSHRSGGHFAVPVRFFLPATRLVQVLRTKRRRGFLTGLRDPGAIRRSGLMFVWPAIVPGN